MASQYTAEKPVKQRTTLKRRLAGGSKWRDMLDEIIASEKADLREMRELRDRTRDYDILRLLTVLYERKMERVTELMTLYEYRDTNGDDQ